MTATATAAATSTFLGWSAHRCAGTGPCAVTLSRDSTSLVARFTPLEVRVVRGGTGAASIVSEPPGIACPPTCIAPFPYGTMVTLIAGPIRPRPSWPGSSAARRRRMNAAACWRRRIGRTGSAWRSARTTRSVSRRTFGALRRQPPGTGASHRPRAQLWRELRAPVRLRLPGGVARDSGRRVALHGVERRVRQVADVPALCRARDVGRGAVHGEPRAAAAERAGDRKEGGPEAEGPALGPSRAQARLQLRREGARSCSPSAAIS